MRRSLFVLCCCCAALPTAAGQAATAPKSHKSDSSEQFFADRAVRNFQIEVSDAEFISLKRRPRIYVEGIVREGGHVFTNVGIHLKGMGSFRSVDEKPSLVLKF